MSSKRFRTSRKSRAVHARARSYVGAASVAAVTLSWAPPISSPASGQARGDFDRPIARTREPAQEQAPAAAQMIHHNVSGSKLNEGDLESATAPIRLAAQIHGVPLAISVNEVCRGQMDELEMWLEETYGVPFSSDLHIQNFTIDECEDGSGSPDYGEAILTIGGNHQSVINASYSAQVPAPPETGSRGFVCMEAGVTGTKGYACSSHLQNLDPGIKHSQWREYCSVVGFIRGGGHTVNFAGDTYQRWPELQEICASVDVGAINADPLARETWVNSAGLGLHVDHIVGGTGQERPQPAELMPLAGAPYPGGTFNSDHRLVVSFIDFDG